MLLSMLTAFAYQENYEVLAHFDDLEAHMINANMYIIMMKIILLLV